MGRSTLSKHAATPAEAGATGPLADALHAAGDVVEGDSPPIHDAGPEANDPSCANIPGPRCGGEGYSPAPGPDDEGFVHVGNGFHASGDTDADGFEVLGPATGDWRNPVAKVTITARRGGD